MTYLLCRWLNEELRLSKVIEPKTFVWDFSNGYLIGEILHKYHLQNDFNMFINDVDSASIMHNFSRLEPTLQLLGLLFDKNTSQGLMQGRHGVATHFLYELYVRLEKKKRGNNGGTLTNPSSASVSQLKRQQDVYSERLHKGLRLNAEITFDVNPYHSEVKGQPSATQQMKPPQKKDIKINLATSVRKGKSQQNQQERQKHKEKQAQMVQSEIHQFEVNTRKQFTSPTRDFLLGEYSPLNKVEGAEDAKSGQWFNVQYIQHIRQRLETDAVTLKLKEKRATQFLEEQCKALKALQEAQHEEQLVKRLTLQAKEEERLVAQLLQIRSQKEECLKKRLCQQQEIQKRREKDFKEALDQEAALARQERLEKEEEIMKALDICQNLATERKQNRYKKHFESCKEILEQIVDLATKAGDYHLHTGNLIPRKQMREWKELLFSGLPLYPNKDHESQLHDPVKQNTLNNHDYEQYKNMVGEWEWPRAAGQAKILPTEANIFNHVITQLRNIVHQPNIKPSTPPFPHCSLKACVLGKGCSGKTTCVATIAQAHGLYILSLEQIVKEALNAYHNKEEVSEQQEKTDDGNLSIPDNQDFGENSTDTQLSDCVMFEAATAMREGKAIPNELLVDMITEAIRKIPAHSGWILDGFPVDIAQAYLLEEALGAPEATNSQKDLRGDPDSQPKAKQPPALDLVLLLEITDENLASRATKQAGENKLAEITSRIPAFEETWPELEEWFGEKQNILVRVNANQDEEELFRTVDSILQQVKKQHPEASVDRKEADVESCSSLNMDQEESRSLKEPSLTKDSNLSDVDEPFPSSLAASLCLHWDTACESYENKIKGVMQELRLQRTTIDLHISNISEEFNCYLGRPDLNQHLLSQWQKDFNVAALDPRKQDKTKTELHTLDDLLEQLWDNSDKRREENEKKIAAFMEDAWLMDHTAILLKHHSTLIQVEVERFQDMLYVLKTYFQSIPKQALPSMPESKRAYDLHSQEESMMSKNFQGHTEYDKAVGEILICDYEKALSTISNLIVAEPEQTKQSGNGEVEKKACPSSDENSFHFANHSSSQELPDLKLSESEICNEYTAALIQQGNNAKARVALIKGHGLEMMDSFQSMVEQILISMKELMKEQFEVEMKRIVHVADLLRQHIQCDSKLQNKLVLDCINFHQKENTQLKTTPPPSPSQLIQEEGNK